MNSKESSIHRIEKQISQIQEVRKQRRFSPVFKKWYRDTEIMIGKVFGEDSRHTKDFTRIHFDLTTYFGDTPESEFDKAFQRGLDNSEKILESMIDEIREYWSEEEDRPVKRETSFADEIVKNICTKFHRVARQMRSRHSDRPTLEVTDEYDAQDLFHALLLLEFNDVRAEEFSPSYGGASSRMDFLLKQDKIVIELKKTRRGLGAKEVGDQLIIDARKYREHPHCQKLICFVYDPEGLISNPAGIENDLSVNEDDFSVVVIIEPK